MIRKKNIILSCLTLLSLFISNSIVAFGQSSDYRYKVVGTPSPYLDLYKTNVYMPKLDEADKDYRMSVTSLPFNDPAIKKLLPAETRSKSSGSGLNSSDNKKKLATAEKNKENVSDTTILTFYNDLINDLNTTTAEANQKTDDLVKALVEAAKNSPNELAKNSNNNTFSHIVVKKINAAKNRLAVINDAIKMAEGILGYKKIAYTKGQINVVPVEGDLAPRIKNMSSGEALVYKKALEQVQGGKENAMREMQAKSAAQQKAAAAATPTPAPEVVSVVATGLQAPETATAAQPAPAAQPTTTPSTPATTTTPTSTTPAAATPSTPATTPTATPAPATPTTTTPATTTIPTPVTIPVGIPTGSKSVRVSTPVKSAIVAAPTATVAVATKAAAQQQTKAATAAPKTATSTKVDLSKPQVDPNATWKNKFFGQSSQPAIIAPTPTTNYNYQTPNFSNPFGDDEEEEWEF